MKQLLNGAAILYALMLAALHLTNLTYRAELPSVALLTTFSLFLFLPLLGLNLLLIWIKPRKVQPTLLLSLGLFLWAHPVVPLMPQNLINPIDASFSAMTFNLGWRVSTAADLSAAIADQQPDILALQELSLQEAAQFRQDLSTLYPYQILDPNVGSVGLLSQFPINRYTWINPPSGRRILHAEIALEDQLLQLFVIHFSTPSFERDRSQRLPYGLTEEHLNRESDFLLDVISNIEGSVLILGDFNMSDQSRAYSKITARYNDAFNAVGWGAGFTFPNDIQVGPVPIFAPIVRIDYAFYSDTLAAVSSDVRCISNLSDHCALYNEFIFM
ncbi:MAG: endonuclease/exonuclease/phosphatase family protein [Chloroflexota bacterium]